MIRAQPNSAIRVMGGNTDTREKDISKMHVCSDAICSKPTVLEVLRKGVFGMLGINSVLSQV